MKKTIIPLLLTFILFSCGNKEDQPKGLKAQLKDTAYLWCDFKNPDGGLNGEAGTLLFGRVVDTARTVTYFQSVKNGSVSGVDSTVNENGIDTSYFLKTGGWGTGDLKKPLMRDSFPNAFVEIRVSRVDKRFIKEVSPIIRLSVFNPFKPIPPPIDTAKAKTKTDSTNIKK